MDPGVGPGLDLGRILGCFLDPVGQEGRLYLDPVEVDLVDPVDLAGMALADPSFLPQLGLNVPLASSAASPLTIRRRRLLCFFS